MKVLKSAHFVMFKQFVHNLRMPGQILVEVLKVVQYAIFIFLFLDQMRGGFCSNNFNGKPKSLQGLKAVV